MEKIIKRVKYSDAEEEDFEFWLSKSPEEKLTALTRMRINYHGGKRMVKVLRKVRNDF
ncbi:MAG TPA: hypothetical protein VFW11_24970 [Cyclobacteriaceae bacterium]|nr:hypothetical protein [Cyclobacteriaceae bacterium]